MTLLNKMSPGQRGIVKGFSDDSPLARRLHELGFIPGRTVTYLCNAPLQDPLAVQVGNSCLSLRHSEAALVTVEVED